MDSYKTEQPILSVPDLPEDVFFIILEHLEAWELLRCQLVSRKWRQAFCQQPYIQFVLNRYRKTRELRNVHADDEETNWDAIFGRISSRYFHLHQGKCRSLQRYEIKALDQTGQWYPIGQWDYHESQPGGRLYRENAATHLSRLGQKPYLFPPTLWCYDDGLVVFAFAKVSVGHGSDSLHVLDIATEKMFPIPFSTSNRIIRNLRLKERTLIIEWAEKHAYHDLNAAEKVHRHFVSCYDVMPISKTSWTVLFRSEWKSHFLGLPLSSRDRFFSTHTKEHYAMYLWQPNRSMYTGDEDLPIEALFVWDISSSSAYLPSEDPAGKFRPDKGPHMVARFALQDLDFLGIRQHANITLMSIKLHSDCGSLTIKENVCENGQGYFDPAERLWCATSITFPFTGFGPSYVRTYDGELPPYRGHCSMESTDIEETERWFLPIMDVYDELADVRFSLVESCFTGLMMENKIIIRVKALDDWHTMTDEVTKEVGALGRIAADERWIIGQNAKMELVIAKFQ